MSLIDNDATPLAKPLADTQNMNNESNLFIDLNADLGEGMGGDEDMATLITSANVAGGGHAGGGEILRETIEAAVSYGVAIGAHPSYPDRENFGRTSMRGGKYDFTDIKNSITDQIIAVAVAAAKEGQSLSHVKAHGALYNDAMVYADSAELFLDALFEAEENLVAHGLLACDLDGVLPVFGLPNSVLKNLCKTSGRTFFSEAFADRAYTAEGLLVPRSKPGSVLETVEEVVEQALQIVTEGTVKSIDGNIVYLIAETLCVHGDTPGAVEMTQEIRQALISANVKIRQVEVI